MNLYEMDELQSKFSGDATKYTLDDSHADLSNGLRELMEWQTEISRAMGGTLNINGGPTPENVRTYALALIAEITELTEAMTGKPWKPGEESSDRILDEFADVLAFVGILAKFVSVKTGKGPLTIAKAYLQKTNRNFKRMKGEEPGYGIKKD